jgi:CBS-domain-containing membrane protein
MSDSSSRYAEHLVIYAMLAVAAAIWLGFGGMVFLGILHDAGAT